LGFLVNVRQRTEDDCAVAAIATACGVPYEAVAAEFPDPERTTTTPAICDFLSRRGFAWQCIARREGKGYACSSSSDPSGKSWTHGSLKEWPPKLWAPLHLVTCDAPAAEDFCKSYGRDASGGTFKLACHHVIVVLQSGDVLDPQHDELQRWEHYRTVYDLWGLSRAAPQVHPSSALRIQQMTRSLG
jgi:hypothetical protein